MNIKRWIKRYYHYLRILFAKSGELTLRNKIGLIKGMKDAQRGRVTMHKDGIDYKWNRKNHKWDLI